MRRRRRSHDYIESGRLGYRGETFRSHVYICKANNVDFLCLHLACALKMRVVPQRYQVYGCSNAFVVARPIESDVHVVRSREERRWWPTDGESGRWTGGRAECALDWGLVGGHEVYERPGVVFCCSKRYPLTLACFNCSR